MVGFVRRGYLFHMHSKIQSDRKSNLLRIAFDFGSGDSTRTCVRQLADKSPTSYHFKILLVAGTGLEPVTFGL
jgi:hypothetical protein